MPNHPVEDPVEEPPNAGDVPSSPRPQRVGPARRVRWQDFRRGLIGHRGSSSLTTRTCPMTSACRNLPSGPTPSPGPPDLSNGTRWIAGGRAGRNPGLGTWQHLPHGGRHLPGEPGWPSTSSAVAAPSCWPRTMPQAEPRSRPHSVHTGGRKGWGERRAFGGQNTHASASTHW